MLILSASDVDAALPISRAIPAMRDAFSAQAAHQVVMPVRMSLEGPKGTTLVMPARIEGRALAVKAVSVFPGNTLRGLPTINSAVLVIDKDTGQPTALLEGRILTAIRTGAVSGLATDLMARREASSLAMFGAGAQSWRQIEAVLAVRPIERVCIVNRSRERAVELANVVRHKARQVREVRVSEAAEALALADIVSLATGSHVPLFEDAWLKPGTHINAVGAFKPGMRETPTETVRRSRFIADDIPSCLEEAGDLLIPLREGVLDAAHIVGDLADLVGGRLPGRTNQEQITFFKSVGLALEDAAAAAVAVDEARRLGLGTKVEF